jgi:hypothetical protein
MALISIRTSADLGDDAVLAPERYDPRREMLHVTADGGASSVGDIVRIVRRTVSPLRPSPGHCIVLDTSDAREGVVVTRKRPVLLGDIGSTKKCVEPGDVLISRLRPYLRQVAWVDENIGGVGPDVSLVCSTEFFVFRSIGGESIAFLVPLLLSRPVQAVLAASQEGGHHPRIAEATLLTLPVPAKLVDQRETISDLVVQSVARFRQAEHGIRDAVGTAESALNAAAPGSRIADADPIV